MRTMHRSQSIVSTLSLSLVALFASFAQANPIAIDDFEDGTTMGWFVPGGSPNPPTNVATGGPAGMGDHYLQLVANGQPGPGGRLAVLNESQWTGDFIAGGIRTVRMSVNNFGPSDLVLRLLFENFGPMPGPPTDLALTIAGVSVPANSGWMNVEFDLALANLAVETFGTVVGALSDVHTMRIFHNPVASFPGPGVGIPLVNVTLGVDNIEAIRVPEPVSGALIACGLAAALLRARRRQRPGRP
jgi:hypothetical protein